MAPLRLSTVAALLAYGGRLASATDSNTTVLPCPEGPCADVPDNGCTVQSNCTGGSPAIPISRGVCIQSVTSAGDSTGTICRDVCNPEHTPQTYRVTTGVQPMDSDYAMAGMVAMVRAGKNPYVQCPDGLRQGDVCPLGTECPYNIRRKFKVPAGRGMCVMDQSQPYSRSCWDMCDTDKTATEYSLGTEAGVAAQVVSMRNGGSCPSRPWWPWVLGIVIVLLLVGCCAALFIQQRNRKKRGGSAPSSSRGYDDRAPEMDYGQDYGLGEPMVEEPQAREMIPSQRSRDEEDDMRAQQEYQMQQAQQAQYQQRLQQQQQYQDQLPPEPPREVLTTARQQAQMQSHRDDMSQGYGVYGGGTPTQQEFGTLPPATGSMKIPGLDEPNLFGSVPPLVGQTTQTVGSSSVLMPSLSQPQVMPGQRIASMGVPSYTTQVPTFMPGGGTLQSTMTGTTSPPASVQVRPGVLQQPQAGQFFTTIARR